MKFRSVSFFIIFIAVALVPFTLMAQMPQTKKVKFPAGQNAIAIKAKLTGEQIIDYKVDLKPGQKLTVSLKSKSTSTYFNVMEPGEKSVAIYNGSIEGNEYSAMAAKAGEYTLRVYQMRSAARRNSQAEYQITITAD